MLLLHLTSILLFAWGAALGARASRLPPLLGMLGGGALGQAAWLHLLTLLELPTALAVGPALADVSGPIRLAVLILVLLRAGLGLSPADLRQAGGLAVRMGSLPMLAEGLAVAVAGHGLLHLDWPTALLMGCLVAAISPAIVVPGLLDHLSQRPAGNRSAKGAGSARRVLVALLAGAPLDNVFALALFGIFLDLAVTGEGSLSTAAWRVPLGLGVSVGVGLLTGALLATALAGRHLRLAFAGAAVWTGGVAAIVLLHTWNLPIAPGLVALGCTLRWRAPDLADRCEAALSRAWRPAAYLLFALIGAAFDPRPLVEVGSMALLVLATGHLARGLGAMLATRASGLTARERLACVAAYVPKATIQAAFAALPLERGLSDGALVMGMAVLAVAISAPLGTLTLMRSVPLLLSGLRGPAPTPSVAPTA